MCAAASPSPPPSLHTWGLDDTLKGVRHLVEKGADHGGEGHVLGRRGQAPVAERVEHGSHALKPVVMIQALLRSPPSTARLCMNSNVPERRKSMRSANMRSDRFSAFLYARSALAASTK